MPQIVHAHSTMGRMQHGTVEVGSLAEMRAHATTHLGPFPILFAAPPGTVMDHPDVPGIVLTALVDIPGAAERGGPFVGAQMMGYVPAVKGPNGDGTKLVPLGILKTPAWFTQTQPTTVEKPFVSTDPLPDAI